MRLLAVHVANGFSPEARVLATLLRYRQSREALVLHHDWTGDRRSAEQFQQLADVRLVRLDVGWRPPPSGWSALPRKVLARLKFRLAWSALLSAARRYQPDVIISSQQSWDCSAATYLATRLHTPQVIQLHYTIGWWLRSGTLARLTTCAHVIAISDFIRQQTLEFGVPPERVTTIKNTLLPAPEADPATRQAVRSELGLSASACLVGFVARLDPYKGHAEAIAAFARVAATHPDVHLLIVGRGELQAALKQQADQSGAGARVHFLGYRTDVPRLLASMDIFIHPSYNEPFGLSVLEAAAAGLPVVAFRSGATDEVVRHEATGLLATEGNIAELADLLTRLVDDADTRHRMGAAGRRRVAEEFNPAEAAARFAVVLDSAAR